MNNKSNYDGCFFYGWRSSPMYKEIKQKTGLFSSSISKERLELLFFVKDNRCYEFFTKEDITDLIQSEKKSLPMEKDPLQVYGSSYVPYFLDPASFASHARCYNAATPQEISVCIKQWREEVCAMKKLYAETESKWKKMEMDDLEWLNKNMW